MNIWEDERGQPSTEMMILLGVAIIVALIVALFLKGLVINGIQPTANNALHEAVEAVD